MWYYDSTIIKHPKAMVISASPILYGASDELPEGKSIGDVKHAGGDITHPKGIFNDSAMLTSLGIKPYSETIPDERYYITGNRTVSESGGLVVGTYATTDRDVTELKKVMLENINEEVSARLGAIDWYWARADKGGTAVPANIATYATTIYSEQATKETEVAALDTLAKIIAYENKPHTEVRKVPVYDAEGDFVEYSGTKSFAIDVNMCKHWTANPTDDVDPAFVSLTAD